MAAIFASSSPRLAGGGESRADRACPHAPRPTPSCARLWPIASRAAPSFSRSRCRGCWATARDSLAPCPPRMSPSYRVSSSSSVWLALGLRRAASSSSRSRIERHVARAHVRRFRVPRSATGAARRAGAGRWLRLPHSLGERRPPSRSQPPPRGSASERRHGKATSTRDRSSAAPARLAPCAVSMVARAVANWRLLPCLCPRAASRGGGLAARLATGRRLLRFRPPPGGLAARVSRLVLPRLVLATAPHFLLAATRSACRSLSRVEAPAARAAS